MKPLLSIVIANYNYGRFLEEAIQSVIAQDAGEQVELIICDAASTDNSVDVIKKYANGLPPNTPILQTSNFQTPNSSTPPLPNSSTPPLPHSSTPPLITWWCSEKDGGQSAAFNKGFSHARGRFLTWLNADDVLLPGTVAALARAAERWPDCEWFVAGCFWLDPNMKVFKCSRARRMSGYQARHGQVHVWGPSSFFSMRLYESVGNIDERFQYIMDIDLWVRFALQAKAVFRPIVRYGWGLRLHPDAKMSGHKFTKEGAILEGEASRQAYKKNTKRVEQIRREVMWMRAKFPDVQWEVPKIMSLMTVDYVPAILSRFDTWRYSGRHLLDVSHVPDLKR